MGLFDKLIGSGKQQDTKITCHVIDHGRQKTTGGHDHRDNTGDDRTPAQKKGDEKRRKKKEK